MRRNSKAGFGDRPPMGRAMSETPQKEARYLFLQNRLGSGNRDDMMPKTVNHPLKDDKMLLVKKGAAQACVHDISAHGRCVRGANGVHMRRNAQSVYVQSSSSLILADQYSACKLCKLLGPFVRNSQFSIFAPVSNHRQAFRRSDDLEGVSCAKHTNRQGNESGAHHDRIGSR